MLFGCSACECGACVRLISAPKVLGPLDECFLPLYEKMREALESAGWTVGEMETVLDDNGQPTFISWTVTCSCCIDCGRLDQALRSNDGSPYALTNQPTGAWVNVQVWHANIGYDDCPNVADNAGCWNTVPGGGPFPVHGDWGTFDWARAGFVGIDNRLSDAGCPALLLPFTQSVPISINGDDGGPCGGIWIPVCSPDSVWCGADKCEHPCGDYTDCELVVRVDGPPPNYEPVEVLRGPAANYITEGCQIEFSLEDPEVNASLTLQKAWWCRPTIPSHNYPVEILLDCNPLP